LLWCENIDDVNRKEWQLIQRLHSSFESWQSTSIQANGYGKSTMITQVSNPWLICIGNGTNWSDWVKTKEIYMGTQFPS
ncbi:14535_t:CDS:2, partial [Funneliformis mosseae]